MRANQISGKGFETPDKLTGNLQKEEPAGICLHAVGIQKYRTEYHVNIFKNLAIAAIALLGVTAQAQTLTGNQGTGWREITVPLAPSSRVHIQAASPSTTDHTSTLIQIDDAAGVANSPLPQVVKDNLLRDGVDGGVIVDRDLANSLADGTATTRYAQWVTPNTDSAFDSAQGVGGSGKKTVQRATREGIFCDSGWKPYTVTEDLGSTLAYLTKTVSDGHLTLDDKSSIKGTLTIVVEYKRSDWSACLPYAFRLSNVTAAGTIDMNDSRLALTATASKTVLKDETQIANLWSKEGVFNIGYLVVWYDVNVPLVAGYSAIVNVSGTVDYSSQLTGVVPFNYTCQGTKCTGTSDTSKLVVKTSTPNLGASADLVVDPYLKVSVKGRLYPFGDSSLASAGIGLKLSTPLEVYGYIGNTCGDSDANGANEMANTYFVDLQARLSAEVTYSLINKEMASWLDFGDWTSHKISGALYRVLNSEGHATPIWNMPLYFKDSTPNGYASIFSPVVRLSSSFKDASGNYNYIVRTSKRPCAVFDTNYIVSLQNGSAGQSQVTIPIGQSYVDTQFVSTAATLPLTPIGVRDDNGRVFSNSGDAAPLLLYMGTGYGTLQYAGISRTAVGSSGDTATITLKNTGTGTITNVTRTCSGQSWHVFGTLPAYILPGATATIQCQAGGSGTYGAPTVSVTAFNANNTPFAPY